jgi:putative oxidoreductase
MDDIRLLGRVLLAGYMCVGAFNNSTGFTPTVEMLRGIGMPAPKLIMSIVIPFEILGAIALFTPIAPYAAILLAIFCVVAPTVAHPFWTMPPSFERFLHMNLFFANIAVAGGMLSLV